MKHFLYTTLVSFLSVSLPAIAGEALPMPANSLEYGCPSTVPTSLAPAPDQRLVFKRSAIGVQVYVCSANAAGATSWLFIAPQANLYTADQVLDGTHFIGPRWQDNDGSWVDAAKAAGETVDPSAIPWLLLKSKGNAGPGRYENITSVQRLNTVGGNAPDSSLCTTLTLGTVRSVPYTADYFFYDTLSQEAEANLQCR